MKIGFTKIVGTGNDFILIDNYGNKKISLTRSLRRRICSRRTGIGADGILLLEKDRIHPFRMRYYNADGREAKMCGNGARCIALFAYNKGIVSRSFSFSSRSGVHSAKIYGGNSVAVSLPPFKFLKSVHITLDGKREKGYHATVGVPHVVFFVKKVTSLDVVRLGRKIRNNPMFKPEGTNVNFAEIGKNKRVSVRTFERGVEDETLSCGTGVAATAAIAVRNRMITSPVRIKTASGETIVVTLKKEREEIFPYLRGKVEIVYSGFVTV
jgi:diaminopimelate epimerase